MNPHRKIRVSPSMSPAMSRPVQGGLTVAALVFVPLFAVAGSDELRATLDFTTGVLSLVSLSAAVAWGLLATDRLFLSTRQRIVCQGVHRATAVASLGFLLLHGTVKVALDHVTLIGALIPFGLGVTGTAGLIGFGSLAGLLMVVTAATGALRSAFAQPSPKAARLGQSLGSPRDTGGIAGRWRALHALAYPAWCFALIHGLYAGRAAATWVVVMYGLCLAAVAGALCLRLLPRPTKRRIADRITGLLGQGPQAVPDPVLRESPLPGAGPGPTPDRASPPRDPAGWSEPDRGVRGTPVRPRTLSAPIPPAGPPPTAIPGSLHEAPTETLYGTPPPPYGTPLHGTPLYEPPQQGYEAPPRSADRLAFGPPGGLAGGPEQGRGQRQGPERPGERPGPGPVPGPGISAGYRAVSRGGGDTPLPPDTRWPAPSPAPPAQAHHKLPYGAEHTYAPPQEPPLYASRLNATPRYTPPHGTPPQGTQAATPEAYATPSYGAPEHDSTIATPFAAPPATPFAAPPASPFAAPDTDPPAGPFTAPPAGEPWHAPAGDRP